MENMQEDGGIEAPSNVEIVGENAAEARFPTNEEAQAQAEEAQKAQLLAGKYQDVDALEKAYKELEAKLGERGQQPDMEQTEAANSGGQDNSYLPPDVATLLDSAGLQGEALAQTWADTGSLSESQYAKLEQQGYSKDVVDTFMHGQSAIYDQGVAQQEQAHAKAQEMAGGEQNLEKLFAWASSHYADAKLDELNDGLADPSRFEAPIKEMLYDYKMTTGQSIGQPGMVNAGEAPVTNTAGYASVDEVLAVFEHARTRGALTEEQKARLANTPMHLIQGVS